MRYGRGRVSKEFLPPVILLLLLARLAVSFGRNTAECLTTNGEYGNNGSRAGWNFKVLRPEQRPTGSLCKRGPEISQGRTAWISRRTISRMTTSCHGWTTRKTAKKAAKKKAALKKKTKKSKPKKKAAKKKTKKAAKKKKRR